MAKSSRTPQQLGKEFEADVGAKLKELVAVKPAYLHRLYDSTSAGAILPSQPGDFIFLYEGAAWLIEVKSSGKFDSLAGKRETLKLFSTDQVVKMRLWYRAGGNVAVIFQSHETKAIELWHGLYIANCFNTPKLRVDSKFRVLNLDKSPNYVSALVQAMVGLDFDVDGSFL